MWSCLQRLIVGILLEKITDERQEVRREGSEYVECLLVDFEYVWAWSRCRVDSVQSVVQYGVVERVAGRWHGHHQVTQHPAQVVSQQATQLVAVVVVSALLDQTLVVNQLRYVAEVVVHGDQQLPIRLLCHTIMNNSKSLGLRLLQLYHARQWRNYAIVTVRLCAWEQDYPKTVKFSGSNSKGYEAKMKWLGLSTPSAG